MYVAGIILYSLMKIETPKNAHSVRCNKRDNTLATVITYTLIVKKNKKNNGTFAADRQTGKNQAQHPR